MITVSGKPTGAVEVEDNVSKWITAIKEARKIANSKIWLILDIRDLYIPSFRTVPKDLHLREVLAKNVQGFYGVVASTGQRLKMKLMFVFLRKGNGIVEYATDAEEVIKKVQERVGVFPPLD